MRAKCAMYGCKNASYNKFGYMLNFHRFPKDPERCMAWKDLCKNPRIMKINYTSLFVCGNHFDKSSFTNQILKNTAVPNMNLPKKALGLFSMSQKNSTECATEFDNGKIEETVPNEDSINSEDEHTEEVLKVEVISEDDESDSNKLLDGSDDESNSSQQSRSVTITQSVASETFTPKITSVNSLAPSTSNNPASTNEITDDSSTFADFIKTRMRSFDPVQRTIAQKLISDVMFLAGTRQLQFGTAVLNPVITGPQITIDRTGPAANSSPQIVAQARLTVNNGAKKSGSFSAYVVDDDSDDDAPLAKRSTNNI